MMVTELEFRNDPEFSVNDAGSAVWPVGEYVATRYGGEEVLDSPMFVAWPPDSGPRPNSPTTPRPRASPWPWAAVPFPVYA